MTERASRLSGTLEGYHRDVTLAPDRRCIEHLNTRGTLARWYYPASFCTKGDRAFRLVCGFLDALTAQVRTWGG